MAVHQNQVFPTVVVEIEKCASPADESGIVRHAGAEGGVFELGSSAVTIERLALVGKVGSKDAWEARVVIVGGRGAHARKSLAVFIQGRATEQRLFGEGPIVPVYIEKRRR